MGSEGREEGKDICIAVPPTGAGRHDVIRAIGRTPASRKPGGP
ncbi:Uncharacterised protein [Bordetella pertussis]|nr:Uncharacterised protein [Bordetella pertussis]